MGTFSYTTGQPLDLAAGKAIDFADLRNSFADVKTFLTGANLDATNIAASVFAPYQVVKSETGVMADNLTTTSGTYYLTIGTSNGHLISGTTTSTASPGIVPLTANDFAITGLSPRLRLTVATATNATAPASNFTYGLYSITSTANSGGNFVTTVGSAVTGSTVTRSAPAASSLFRDSSGDFAFPTTGPYLFGVALSAGIATNSIVNITYSLQVHWV
jgi:hypothetical protein